MIVKCVRIKVDDFPFSNEIHLNRFRRLLRGASIEKGFDDLVVGKEYVVYAIDESQGYPFYFVESSDQFFDFHLQPSPCFEIVDSRVSKYWHYQRDIYVSKTGEETFRSSLGIKQWWEDGFLNHLLDEHPHEMAIWKEAAQKIKIEALEAKAKNSRVNEQGASG